MELHDEQHFIQQLRSGKTKAIEELYTLYGNKIYQIAYRMLGTHEDAQDITQETIYQICNHIAEFQGDSRLFTWIYSITKHLCFRLAKQKKRNNFSGMQTLLHEGARFNTSETIKDREKQLLINQIKDGCFSGLLRCLSFNQRMAFILNVLLYLPITDVAAILEKSEGATRVLVHRARQNLKEFLCQNCSLYNSENPCHCENLLGFSLSRGWITQQAQSASWDETNFSPSKIETEVSALRDVVALYQTLQVQIPEKSFDKSMHEHIQKSDWIIFSKKKV